jgi:hypothetical protein
MFQRNPLKIEATASSELSVHKNLVLCGHKFMYCNETTQYNFTLLCSESSVAMYQTTRRHIPEDRDLNTPRREDLKSQPGSYLILCDGSLRDVVGVVDHMNQLKCVGVLKMCFTVIFKDIKATLVSNNVRELL